MLAIGQQHQGDRSEEHRERRAPHDPPGLRQRAEGIKRLLKLHGWSGPRPHAGLLRRTARLFHRFTSFCSIGGRTASTGPKIGPTSYSNSGAGAYDVRARLARPRPSGSPARQHVQALNPYLLLVPLTLVACGDAPLEPSPAPPVQEPVDIDGPPDVLLISIDTLRADRLSCYGHDRETSPVIDALAASGVRFETAYSPMSTTSPAHASLFASLHPVSHHVMRNGLALPEAVITMAEVLKAARYVTAGFVSAYPLDPQFGYDRGFAHYDATYDPPRASDPHGGLERRAAHTVNATLDWLDTSQIDYPLFLFVHLFDPHEMYLPPPKFAAMFPAGDGERQRQKALYDAEIRYTDTEIGRLIEGIDHARDGRRRITVLTADHGQGLWTHEWRSHNAFTYDEEVRIPLIFAGDGIPAGHVLQQHAHLIDIAPTLYALLGVEAPNASDLQGLDLSAAVTSGRDTSEQDRPIFLQRPQRPTANRHAGRPVVGFGFGVRYGDWKYFEAPSEGLRELYDISKDKQEKRNLAAEQPEAAAKCSAIIAAWLETLGWTPSERESELPPDVIESLRALGYLGEDEG